MLARSLRPRSCWTVRVSWRPSMRFVAKEFGSPSRWRPWDRRQQGADRSWSRGGSGPRISRKRSGNATSACTARMRRRGAGRRANQELRNVDRAERSASLRQSNATEARTLANRRRRRTREGRACRQAQAGDPSTKAPCGDSCLASLRPERTEPARVHPARTAAPESGTARGARVRDRRQLLGGRILASEA
jgi:hypothetical protein